MLRDRSPALGLQLKDLDSPGRDRLVALLADFNLVAIHEDDPVSAQYWTAHFASRDARDSAADAIREQITAVEVEALDVEDEDWARRTQVDLPAVRVGRIIVAPPWDIPTPHSPPPIPASEVVIIEPSRGFGTGHHQSTRLCLALLQTRQLTGRTMIDVGTGSGVLAIAAAKLGTAFVAAIDVDPDAVENARENIALNGVGAIVEAHIEDFSSSSRTPGDVVTANLTGSLLARGGDALGRLVKPAGELIVSGFNIEERRMVEEAFAYRFAVAEAAEEDDWWAYVLR
jgi:ribosomal protein L11 methyltransferase